MTRAVLDRAKRLEFFVTTSKGTGACDVGIALVDDVEPVVDNGLSSKDDPARDRDFNQSGGGGAGSRDSKNSKTSSSKKSEAGSQSLPNAGSGVLAGSASHQCTWSKAEAQLVYEHRISS